MAEKIVEEMEQFPYDVLRGRVSDEPECRELTTPSGRELQVEVLITLEEDAEETPSPTIRVDVSVDDGGFHALVPIVISFPVRSAE